MNLAVDDKPQSEIAVLNVPSWSFVKTAVARARRKKHPQLPFEKVARGLDDSARRESSSPRFTERTDIPDFIIFERGNRK